MADIDITKIREIGLRLSQSVLNFTPRSFVHQIRPGKEPRIQVLVGFRGLGKTTALLQLLKQDKSVYFSMDHPYVLGSSLYELGKTFITAGYKTILVDEEGRIRIDDLEMAEDVQKEVNGLWQKVNTQNVKELADVEGYHQDFLRLFGFEFNGVDYSADVNPEVNFSE